MSEFFRFVGEYIDSRPMLAAVDDLYEKLKKPGYKWTPAESFLASVLRDILPQDGQRTIETREFWEKLRSISNYDGSARPHDIDRRVERLFSLIDRDSDEALPLLEELKSELGRYELTLIRAECMFDLSDLGGLVKHQNRLEPVVKAALAWCKFRAAGVAYAIDKLNGGVADQGRDESYDELHMAWRHAQGDPFAHPPGRRLPTGECVRRECPGLLCPPTYYREDAGTDRGANRVWK